MSFRRSHIVTGHDGVTLVADLYPQFSTGRPSVILLHGGGQNRHAWTKTARTIHAAGHHVIAYDTRGHRDSSWDPAGRYDTEDLAYDLLAVRERYCGRRPAVAVISAYNPHRPRPDTVDGLTKVLRQRNDGRWVWRWDPAFITSKLEVMRADPGNSAHRFQQAAEQLLDGARRITAPALLVRGAMSDLVGPDTVDEFLAAVPHATSVDVSDTGHMVAGDDNDAFTNAVLALLDRIPPIPQPRQAPAQ